MTASPDVVLLIGSATDPATLLESIAGDVPIDEMLSGGQVVAPSVGLVSLLSPLRPIRGIACVIPLDSQESGPLDHALNAAWVVALLRWVTRFPIGRLIASFGPTDQSRVFRRAVRRNREAMGMTDAAFLVIAVDLPAVRTAWDAVHSGRVPRALHGLSAAARERASR